MASRVKAKGTPSRIRRGSVSGLKAKKAPDPAMRVDSTVKTNRMMLIRGFDGTCTSTNGSARTQVIPAPPAWRNGV
jgi:hypothetical protein